MNNIKQILIDDDIIVNGKIRPRKLIYWDKSGDHNAALIRSTPFLTPNATTQERAYCIQENLLTRPLCPICSKHVTFVNGSKGYRLACSPICGKKLPSTQYKRSQTILKKYGVSHYSKTDEFKLKYKNTSLLRYGQSDAKMTTTAREAATTTMIDRYGGYTLASPTLSDKVKHTMMDRYGKDHPMKVQTIRLKHSNSTDRNGSDHIDPSIHLQLSNYDWLYNQHVVLKKSLPHIAFENGVSQFMVWNNCTKLHIKVQRFTTSSHEQIVYDELIKYISDTDIILNDRQILNGKELDLYIPSLNLAFEINGLYWHNDEMPRMYPTYHQSKSTDCLNLGIRLISIFEDQINDDWSLIEHIIYDATHDIPDQYDISTLPHTIVLNMQYMHIVLYLKGIGYEISNTEHPTRYSIRNTKRYLDDDGPLFIHDCGNVTLIKTGH